MLRIYLCDISHMRVATSLSGLLSRQLAYKQRDRDERCRTGHKESRQNTREAATIFETVPAGASILVELDTAIGATKSAGWL
jgi:hypothetical protein